jgi:alkanesulfonate monooxygenase
MTLVPITSASLNTTEVSWFSALCSDDYEYLGIPDGRLRSSWEHCSKIVTSAEANGFRNILCPSSYQVGQDTLSFVAGCAPITENINLLAAIRCGEMHPIMLARTVATLDHMLKGRLTLNIISSDFPGQKEPSSYRYQRSREVVQILKQAWTQDQIDFEGVIYNFQGVSTEPARPYQQNGGPLLYFGGYSPDAIELCAEHCDVYLMWPETKDDLANRMIAVNNKAEAHNRTLDYGLRVHMVVRDTEVEAREFARELVSKLDDDTGSLIRERALDSSSFGVSRQSRNRSLADMDGFIEPHLWTGVGRARSGCGAALVGSADQILSEIESYQKMGMRSFIFSGYPHLEECDYVGKLILPELQTCSLPHEYGRVPSDIPATPLGNGFRK